MQGDQGRVRPPQRASFEYQTLKREAEGDKKLYEELIRKIKEAGINASFQNSIDPRGRSGAPRV